MEKPITIHFASCLFLMLSADIELVQLKTQRHMGEFSLQYYFSASIYTEKLVGIITIKLYCLTDLRNIRLFNDKSVEICRVLMHLLWAEWLSRYSD